MNYAVAFTLLALLAFIVMLAPSPVPYYAAGIGMLISLYELADYLDAHHVKGPFQRND